LEFDAIYHILQPNKEHCMEITRPETVGFSSSRLARIGLAMQRYVDSEKLAGTLTLVARHDKIAHFQPLGLMDVASEKPMARDTIFRIYSMTKPITSVAVMMLYEEGHFLLTDPIEEFVPAFADVRVLGQTGTEVNLVPPQRAITIRDLLTHTAGLGYGLGEDYIDRLYQRQVWRARERNPEMTLEEMVEAIAALPLAYHPGQGWRYSYATDVLGYLVQVVSGVAFDAYLEERIFQPLGMTDTAFYVPPDKVDRFATNYGPGTDGAGLHVIDAPANSRYTRPDRIPSGGGGLVSTATDYVRFAQMLLNKGALDGVRLLSRKSVELMTMNHLPPGLHPFGGASQGMGLGVGMTIDLSQTQALGSVGAYGWGGAASTYFWVDPQEGLIGVFMTQLMPSGTYPVHPEFRVAVYQALVD
jgi:CubicO group peptidase (beta-lactamase class C family)